MNTTITLRSPITDIKGFGPKKAESFARLGIFCIEDLLRYFPRDYEDLRNKKSIAELVNGERAVVEASVLRSSLGRGYGRKRALHLVVADGSGSMEIIFFMAGFMGSKFKAGESYRFFGRAKLENGRAVMFHPAYSSAEDGEAGIQPVYPLSSGLTQKDLKKALKAALPLLGSYEETLPAAIIKKANLCPIDYAISNIHFPEDGEIYRAARFRLIFEELFDLRTALKLSAERFGKGRSGISFNKSRFADFTASLSYKLTGAQSRVLCELEKDMDSSRAMNRLVQGDVGSGKTVIAEAAVYKAAKAGFQAAFMAPTEILAAQHFESFKQDLGGLGLNIDHLTGSMSAREKKQVLMRLEDGTTDIVVGTHAIISDSVRFKNLGLAVTDEQHRFGVNQRKLLGEKGLNPDILVMTATPIPRTLAAVLYSDLDISVIDELPPGRKKTNTRKYNETDRGAAYDILFEEIAKGRQAYIVAAFIEDSESIDARSAESLYAELTKQRPDISFGLLHGELRQSEKDAIMKSFADGEIKVLISTVVIEVGINVANATVMLIENAERFGLAQLHQLRGRVGRGTQQSYCLLVLGDDSEIAGARADIMCSESDGFVIAEKDLKIRGPGELFGYRQHGLPQMQLADPVRHAGIVELASKMADELLKEDPSLELPENRLFGDKIRSRFSDSTLLVL